MPPTDLEGAKNGAGVRARRGAVVRFVRVVHQFDIRGRVHEGGGDSMDNGVYARHDDRFGHPAAGPHLPQSGVGEGASLRPGWIGRRKFPDLHIHDPAWVKR